MRDDFSSLVKNALYQGVFYLSNIDSDTVLGSWWILIFVVNQTDDNISIEPFCVKNSKI